MIPEHVETIERATADSVAPDEVHEVDGFLVGIDCGTLGRARSSAPLRHDLEPDPAVLDEIDALYRARGYRPIYRVADVAGLAPLQHALRGRGFAPDTATLVKVGDVAGMLALTGARSHTAPQPDAAWTSVFNGEGFDPVDGANRIRNLSRAAGSLFASVRDGHRALAVGAGGFGHGWLSIHGMRTDPNARGRGYAGRILATLAEAAQGRGLTRAFLQVLEANETARSLYRRAGFVKAWRYEYWSPTSPAP